MRLAAFATWQPGRGPVRSPRNLDEQEFLDHEWWEDGLLLWAPVQGVVKTASRVEDLASWAVTVSDGAEVVASNNARCCGQLLLESGW